MAFMRNANNLNWAFTATYHGAASTGVVNEATDLNHGEVAVLNENNTILSGALSAGDQFKIAQRIGAAAADAELLISPLFTFQSGAASDYVAASQQVTTIGSNGTTTVGLGDFAVNDDTAALAAVGNSYYVLIEKQDNDEANRSGYQPSITAQVKLTNPNSETLGEAISLRLAEQLREAIRVNDQLEVSKPSTKGPKYVAATVRAVATEAAVYSSGSGQTFAVTHGSTTVTASTATNLSVVAGDFITFGANGDMYRVASVDSATITLDFPYAGVSDATVDVASSLTAGSVCRVTAANADAVTGVGVCLTGMAIHEFDVDRNRLYGESRFNVRFAKDGENVGATITTTQPNNGNGDYKQVLTDFYNSAGNLGQRWVSDTPAVSRTAPTDGSGHDAFTSSSLGFGTIAVSVEKTNKTLLSSGTAKQLVRLYLAFDDNTTDGISGTAQTNLETIFGAAGVITDAAS